MQHLYGYRVGLLKQSPIVSVSEVSATKYLTLVNTDTHVVRELTVAAWIGTA